MADTTINSALAAYKTALRNMGEGAQAPEATGGSGFAELLNELKDQAIGAGQEAEKQSMLAATGKANINDVVMAVSSAELTLQTVTAVRDRVISAYQEIMRMPI
jgi:flagellar hook-basal body complex protein FliE